MHRLERAVLSPPDRRRNPSYSSPHGRRNIAASRTTGRWLSPRNGCLARAVAPEAPLVRSPTWCRAACPCPRPASRRLVPQEPRATPAGRILAALDRPRPRISPCGPQGSNACSSPEPRGDFLPVKPIPLPTSSIRTCDPIRRRAAVSIQQQASRTDAFAGLTATLCPLLSVSFESARVPTSWFFP